MRTGETFWFLDGLMRIHVASDATANGISVIEHSVPQGSSPPLHVHHNEDEIFHVLAGEVRFLVDGSEVYARQGDTVLAPKGRPHSFVATSAAGARWLLTTCRGDFERMARSVSRPAQGGRLPPAGTPTPAEVAALETACRMNPIELLGPPLSMRQPDLIATLKQKPPPWGGGLYLAPMEAWPPSANNIPPPDAAPSEPGRARR